MSLTFEYRLDELTEVECFSLVIDGNVEATREWFEERGFDGNGYSVHGLVDSIVRWKLPELFDELSFSPEADNLMITCDERGPLEEVQKAVEAVSTSESALQEAVDKADPECME